MIRSKVVILGAGATGLLALLHLHHKKIPLSDIVLVDPHHDGGDLQRKWASVISNTTWGQTLAIVRTLGYAEEGLPEPWKSIDPSKPTALAHSISLLRYLCKPLLSDCDLVFGECRAIREEGTTVFLDITLCSNESMTLEAKICLVAIGANPKRDCIPLPSIPLEIALQKETLATYVSVTPQTKVMVFGTSHSGTLVLRNLQDLQIDHVAIYKGTKPFSFARDGEYDGVKQDSEKIADNILAGKFTHTTVIPLTNTAQVIRWSKKADWVIYATGFQRRALGCSLNYDAKTGRIRGTTRVWGFGIAFPNQAPDGIHFDVSLPSFSSHLELQLPSLLESFYG